MQYWISHDFFVDFRREFLKPGAPCEINIDGKTMEAVQQSLTTPSRFTFDCAAEHIYALLLKKDCYPRFIRSEHYRSLVATGIQPSHKKRFFGFGGAAKKKSTTTAPANVGAQVRLIKAYQQQTISLWWDSNLFILSNVFRRYLQLRHPPKAIWLVVGAATVVCLVQLMN